ncbi:MAG: Ig-like domain-containing protein, partial [Candidatus Symbiothrix sp.]|nr:Ig-like domain-containing protein [Candidatus Symbiothrix sp.]
MNKKLLLLPVVMMFITAGCSLANAQVKIGGNPETGITSGVLLELGDATSTSGGLLLPRVVLTAENANPFGDGESMDLPAGLLVYNLGSETEGEALDEGLYVLKGGLWVQAGSGGSDTPLMNVAITPNTPVTLYSTGNSKQLNPAISIADSTTIIWTSSNTDVAVVSDKGVVSPVADGEAEITV